MKRRLLILSSVLGITMPFAFQPGWAHSGPLDTVSWGALLPLPQAQLEDNRLASNPPTEEITPRTSLNGKGDKAQRGKIQIEGQNPETGETVNIDISSNELGFNNETGEYTVTGDVYMVIPEQNVEVLADKVIYNPKEANLVATGHVFIIQDKNIMGSQASRFDIDKNIAYFTEPRTITEAMRIRAEDGARGENFTVLHQGRLIISDETIQTYSSRYRRRGLRAGQGAVYSYYSARNKQFLLKGQLGNANMTDGDLYDVNFDQLTGGKGTDLDPLLGDKPVSPSDILKADFSGQKSPYRFSVKTINVRRGKDGFDEIDFRQVKLKYKKLPSFWVPLLDFGYIPDKSYLAYLGPDFGYYVDYGGFYMGPGWDFRLFDGWAKVSPIVSYGGGRRLRTGPGDPDYVDPQFGVGLVSRFRSPSTHVDFGYSSTLREPIFLGDYKLFGRNQTRLRVGANQFYRNGFFGLERPEFIAEVVDSSGLFEPFNKWSFKTYTTFGVARDEFFPTRETPYFVNPTATEPVTTTRLQLQAQLRPLEPLFTLGDFASVSSMVQARGAFYGTGDFYGVVQAGPYINLVKGPVYTQLQYLYGQTVGETPFVFDSFYRGRNNVQTINALDLGKYVTVGAVHSLSLNRDNARKDLLVDQKIFLSAGPKNFKVSLAFDVIRKRTLFGLTFNPEGGEVLLDFNTMNIYGPDFDPRVDRIPQSVVAPKKKRPASEKPLPKQSAQPAELPENKGADSQKGSPPDPAMLQGDALTPPLPAGEAKAGKPVLEQVYL